MNSISDSKMRKALTFRASSIGDCLMGKYLLENVHLQYPDALLGLVVAGRGNMIRDLFAAYPWLRVVEANRRSPLALLSLWKEFRGSDLVVTQYAGKQGGQFGLASKFAARALSRAGGLVGFVDTSPWNFIYDSIIPINNENAVAEHDRAALRVAGVPISLRHPTMKYVIDDSTLLKFGLKKGQYIIVHLFSGSTKRGLQTEVKRTLINRLEKAFPTMRLVITGGTGDREEAAISTEESTALIIAGEATLQETMNLISGSTFVVSVDTGIAHITAQIGKPLVVLRTCLAKNWWIREQYGGEAKISICSHDEKCSNGHVNKDYPECINSITPDEVLEKVTQML